MITMKVWSCARCGAENMFSEPAIMVVMEERDYCKKCNKIRSEEQEYRVRM